MLTQRRKENTVGEPASPGERETWPFGSSFCFFLPLGLLYVNWAQPGALFVLPEVLTLVLTPSFVLFSRALPFRVF